MRRDKGGILPPGKPADAGGAGSGHASRHAACLEDLALLPLVVGRTPQGSLAVRRGDAPAAQGTDQCEPPMRQTPIPWNRLDWNLMRLFHEIVRHGGVTAAARALGRQQPATSQALARLEDHLGVKLCERGPGGFALTAEGEIVHAIAAEMVALVGEAPDRLAQAVGEVRGRLSIAVMSSVFAPEFDDVLGAIARRHRLLEISLELAPWRTIVERVRAGEFDVGICYDRELQPDLSYLAIFSETQQLYCSPRHPLFGTRFEDPAALADEAFFLTGRDEPLELTNFRRRYGLGRITRGGSEDLGELKRLVMTGAALAFLPTRNVVGETARRTLWPLLATHALPSYPVHLITRPAASQPLPVRLFVEEARRLSAARPGPSIPPQRPPQRPPPRIIA